MKVPPPGSNPLTRERRPAGALELARHREGSTRLVVPGASLTTVPPPTHPVFFNPAASLNRDVTVALSSAAGARTFCDAMAGTGARGVRVAREVEGVEVALVDFNRDALALARRSARLNGVARRCSFTVSETSAYLFSRFGRDQRFDAVDVDPFGSPVRQLQAGLSATAEGGVLSVTATDTAVLCGVHSSTCRRRYGSTPVNNGFAHETGIRILFAAMVRLGASIDIGVEPVAAHSTRHYIRAFAKVMPGAVKAEGALQGIGSVTWCPGCGDARTATGAAEACALCGRKLKTAGPLWTGGLTDEKLVARARKEAARLELFGAADALSGLAGVDGFPPWSFDIDEICSELGIPTVPELQVHRALTEAGHRAMRTPFEKRGLKSDAVRSEVVEAVKSAAKGRRR